MPNLLELDLSSNLVSNLKNLEQYENNILKSLWLGKIDLKFDSSFLGNKFPNLETLDVGGCRQMIFSQFNNQFSKLAKLKKLILNNLNINFDLIYKSVANLENLEYLDVSNNQIESINIPHSAERIKTQTLKYLNLSCNRLYEFNSSNLFFFEQKYVQVIDLSFNSISFIDLYYLRFSNQALKVIKVNNNNLAEVEFLFKENLGLSSKTVDLSFNRINSFEKQIYDTVNIKYLKMNDNSLDYITNQMFRNDYYIYISDIFLLDFNRNKLKYIRETALLDLFNLKYLQLSQNQLTQIENETFHNLINLVELDLSCNKLIKLDKDVLKSSSFLKNLNLSSNKFEFLNKELFVNLNQLSNFDISNNLIRSISFLSGLSKLTELRIQLNPITTFEKLFGLDLVVRVTISRELLNRFANIENLISSFYKEIAVKSRFVTDRQNISIKYFKSVNLAFPFKIVSPFYNTDLDCFNVLYLIKHGIILNMHVEKDLELFKTQCKTYIHKLFVN